MGRTLWIVAPFRGRKCVDRCTGCPERLNAKEAGWRQALRLPAVAAFRYNMCFSGGVAQLGERLVRNQKVGGSIPPVSTTSLYYCFTLTQARTGQQGCPPCLGGGSVVLTLEGQPSNASVPTTSPANGNRGGLLRAAKPRPSSVKHHGIDSCSIVISGDGGPNLASLAIPDDDGSRWPAPHKSIGRHFSG